MAVETTTTMTGPLPTNGITTVFNFTFQAMSAEEVDVFTVSAANAVASISGYDVTLSDTGGYITCATAPASGLSLYIAASPDFRQQIVFERGSRWLPDPVNEGLDRSAARDLWLRSRVSLLSSSALMVPSLRAGKVLAWDASGEPYPASGTGADSALRTDLASTGASLVAAADGASGTLWTSVAGFIAKIISSAGASVIGFILNATGTVGRTVRDKLGDIGHWKDFGIKADGTTDDTAAVQAAFNWCGPGKVLIMPSAKVKITSTITYGNGTTASLSTIGNNCTVIWGGEPSNANALIDSSDPWYATAQAGTRFVWAGADGGTMFRIAGPIQGLRWLGCVTLDGGASYDGAPGASYCIEAKSFSACTLDTIVAVNWKASGRGVLLTTIDSTGVGTVGANSVLSGGNRIGRVFAFSPYGHNGECLRIDGYKMAGGQDVTVTDIGTVQCGISGTGAKGLVLGYCDDVTIQKLVNVRYGSISGSPWGVFLLSTPTPFEAPARVYIYHAAVGQGLSAGGGTNAQVIIEHYEMDDEATIPGVNGLFIRNICKTGSGLNMMAYPSDGKLKTRALADGEGFYGLDGSGNTIFSFGRYGAGARATSAADISLEPTGKLISLALKNSTSYANDAAAASGGVPVGGFYRNGSAVQIRVA